MKVMIIGGGAVGLVQALLLQEKGIDVTVYEKLLKRPNFKRIVGIDGKSLSIFRELGLDKDVIALGKKISRACVYYEDKMIADFSLLKIHRDFPFFLTLSLSDLETFLETKVKKIKKGVELKSIKKKEGRYTAFFSEKEYIAADLIIGADGPNSKVRELVSIKTKSFSYPFSLEIANQRVGKEEDRIQLFFEKGKSASLRFPYSQDHVQVIRVIDPKYPPIDEKKTIRGTNESVFNLPLEKKLAATFFYEGLLLIGDAAHHMTPFGGRGLNLSFQDVKIYALAISNGTLKKAAKKRRFRAKKVILETHIIAMMEARGTWMMIFAFKLMNRFQFLFIRLMTLHINITKGKR